MTKPVDRENLLRAVSNGLKTLPANDAKNNDKNESWQPTEPSSSLSNMSHEIEAAAIVSSLPADDPEFAEIIVDFIERLGSKLKEIDAA